MKIGKHIVTKKEILKISGLAVLVCLCVFGAVKVNSCRKIKGIGFPASYLLAAFDTTGTGGNNGSVIYYDENFKEVFRQDIPMGKICNSYNPPVVYKDKVYVAPFGDAYWGGVEEVLEIDRKTGKQKKYKTNLVYAQGLAVAEDYVFTVNNLDGITHLVRTEKESGEILELSYPGEFSMQIDVYGQYLYYFMFREDAEGGYQAGCRIIDIDSMKEAGGFDITEYGKEPDYTYMKDKILYMPIAHTSTDEHCGILLKYDTETKMLEAVDLGYDLPCQILEYEGKLVITHVNLSYANPGECSVSFYDLKTGHLENYAVESTLDQAVIKDGKMYALDTQEQKIFIYDMDVKGDALELKGSYKLKSKDGTVPYRYYTGGFFMR